MKKITRIINLITILTLISYMIISIFSNNYSYAVQTREDLSDKINKYPGYAELINSLKASHPNWNFTIFYTGLDWNEVIKQESVHQRNLIYYTSTGAWICPICGDNTRYSGGAWKCPSAAAISYYMDPRNSLTESYVFQFESLSFNKKIQNIEGVKQILKDVKYMQGDTITYTKTDGTKDVINKSYAQIIMEAAEEVNISPYHLASRLRQEQGVNGDSGLINGTYPGFVGYYNYFNIEANGKETADVIRNGLSYAKRKGLTSPEESIKDGARFIVNGYISSKQDTLYLQKFDVVDNGTEMYNHQYMQNISASKSEGMDVRDSYNSLGLLNASIDFIIPVYENMPTKACEEPGKAETTKIVTQDVKVKGTEVRVRAGQSTSSTILTEVNTGDVLLKIEINTQPCDGNYWSKVVLPDGRKGYVASQYLVDVPDITNCKDKIVTSTEVNLRNGPGLEGTTVIKMLSANVNATRIEQGKYNLDGHIWDRIVLEDGTKGYVTRQYIKEPETEKFKIEDTNIIGTPSLTIEDLKNANKEKTIVVKDSKGTVVEKGSIGTGYKVTIDKEEYTMVKLGDLNGDAKVNTVDGLNALKYDVGLWKLDENQKKALDVNRDGKVNTVDGLVLLKYDVGLEQINL